MRPSPISDMLSWPHPLPGHPAAIPGHRPKSAADEMCLCSRIRFSPSSDLESDLFQAPPSLSPNSRNDRASAFSSSAARGAYTALPGSLSAFLLPLAPQPPSRSLDACTLTSTPKHIPRPRSTHRPSTKLGADSCATSATASVATSLPPAMAPASASANPSFAGAFAFAREKLH
uniref:N/A n=1 Tax=Ganoderma boninense TaxID=34458 RepID=A0A5K1JU23_9APHY|nr:N/A [Ganoderma boninense]